MGHSLDQGLRQGEDIAESRMGQTRIKANTVEGAEVLQFLAVPMRRVAAKAAQGADANTEIHLLLGMVPEVALEDGEVVAEVVGHQHMLIKLGR